MKCGGQDRPLRYQSFQLLVYFLDHPGLLLGKDELTSAIWSDTAVTDNALVQCIAEIRRGLNDDSRNPQFIKTFPKYGYRFVMPVQVTRLLAESLAPDTPSALVIPERGSAPQSVEASKFQIPFPAPRSTSGSTAVWTLSRLFSTGVFALVLLSLYGDKTQAKSSSRATVLSSSGTYRLAMFPLQNGTGRVELNWLCEGMPRMILSNLARAEKRDGIRGSRTQDVLNEVSSPADFSLSSALEVARSVKATDFITGTILAAGQRITIRVDTRDAKDGHLIASDSTPLGSLSETAVEATLISAGIARHLGIKTEPGTSPSRVATHDVEASRYYSLGVEKVAQFQNLQAIGLFKQAIELDPHFAMAYARIGYAYAVMDFQPESASHYLERAAQLSGSLPALDRLYIDAWTAVAHADYNSAIGVLQQITKQYPDEVEASCQLSRLLRGQERVAEASSLLQNAIQQNPDAKDLYNSYGLIQFAMEKPAEALDSYKQYVALDPRNPNSHDSLGMAYQQVGQYDAALAEYNEALRLDPDFQPSIVHLGDSYYQQGEYREALREYQRYIHVAGYSDARALGYGDLATVYSAMNKLPEAQRAAAEELRSNNKAVWNSLVFALTEHHTDRASELTKRLLANTPNPERGSPPDLRMSFFHRGFIEFKMGNTESAIGHFKSALTHLPPSSGIDSHEDCLANAYLEMSMFPEAVEEYQRILKLNANYPLAYYHLAKAYRGMHNQGASEIAFEHFLAVNQDADHDSPPVLEALREVEARASVPGRL